MKLPEDLASLPNIKTCLGSCEELIFIDRLESHPWLQLQDLTLADIHGYVEPSLDISFMTSVKSITPEKSSYLADMIVDRANSVFLWVYLVTKAFTEVLYTMMTGIV